MTKGRPWRVKLCVAALLSAMPFIAWSWVRSWVALDVPPPMSDDNRTATLRALRGLDHDASALELPLSDRGPVVVSLWSAGRRVVRTVHYGDTLRAAITAARKEFLAQTATLSVEEHARSRLQVDVVVARGPVATHHRLFSSIALVPGMDGLGVVLDKGEILVGADELVHSRFLLGHRPMQIPEFYIGLDFDGVDGLLAARADLGPGQYGRQERRYFRFRAESFIESPDQNAALTLRRTLPNGPLLSPSTMLVGATACGQYLSNHLTRDGRFVYLVDLATGEASDPTNHADYSLPRHAGATYFMGQLYAVTKDPQLRVGLQRAIAHMVGLISDGACHGRTEEGAVYACLVDRGQSLASLGSTALATVALAQYEVATGDKQYSQVHLQLVNFLLWMQKADGQFCHLFDVVNKKRDLVTHYPYFDGEAALGLIRSHPMFPDDRLVRATERALDSVVSVYDNFVGQFFFGEEHWTCIAAEAAWPRLQHDRYRDLCSRYARFLRTQQFQRDEAVAQPDFGGAYGGTALMVPQNTPAGSRSEAMISAYLLGVHHDRPEAAIREQVLGALFYLLRQQISDRNDYAVAAANAHGAIPASTIDRTVRIDYLQHVGSAMLRAIPLVPDDR